MDFTKLIEWIKLSPKYLLPIGLVTGFLLFANDVLLAKIGLADFVANFRAWVGIIFLLIIALISVDIAYEISAWIKTVLKNLRNRKKRLERLLALTPDEKVRLLSYVINNTRTRYFPINDGVVSGLESESVIYKSSNVGDMDNWAYNIHPWAWHMLKQHFNEIFSEKEVGEFMSLEESASKKSRRRAGYWW